MEPCGTPTGKLTKALAMDSYVFFRLSGTYGAGRAEVRKPPSKTSTPSEMLQDGMMVH